MKQKRKWKDFPGNEQFTCDGWIMKPKAKNNYFFYLHGGFAAISIMFFAFDCPFLSVNLSLVIPGIGAALFIFILCMLLRTIFIDPGIIPRNTTDVSEMMEYLNSGKQARMTIIKGRLVALSFCSTCLFFRPPRASHCSFCDSCIERFNHHCHWVGKCIGVRNYRFFYFFLLSFTCFCVFVLLCVITRLVLLCYKGSYTQVSFIIGLITCGIETIICIFLFWHLVYFVSLHTYLLASERTTREHRKGLFPDSEKWNDRNPFSQGSICRNFCYVLCGPLPPSLINRRGFLPIVSVTLNSHETKKIHLPTNESVRKDTNRSSAINEIPADIEKPSEISFSET